RTTARNLGRTRRCHGCSGSAEAHDGVPLHRRPADPAGWSRGGRGPCAPGLRARTRRSTPTLGAAVGSAVGPVSDWTPFGDGRGFEWRHRVGVATCPRSTDIHSCDHELRIPPRSPPTPSSPPPHGRTTRDGGGDGAATGRFYRAALRG